MAIRYYDDAIVQKLQRWLPEYINLRILKPDETKRLIELIADDTKDKPVKMPFIALSRNTSFELLSNIKQPKSYDGLWLNNNRITVSGTQIEDGAGTAMFNAIPILPQYQIDIYTKTYEEGDELLRNVLFKLINNPAIYITIPYNNQNIKHIANIRVLTSITDNSGINERLFSGQFTRWTIQLEIHDAFLFSIPYKTNWHIGGVGFEVSNNINEPGDQETFVDFQNL